MQDINRKIHAKKIRYTGLLLAVLFIFSGCTKKDELLFLSEETAASGEEADRTEKLQSAEETTASAADSTDSELSAAREAGTESVSSAETGQGVIYIHVCGAVRQPGVYELKAGSRVYEAVQAAGGFAEGADQDYVNQAQTLGDGIKLVIPTLEEAGEAREREAMAGTMQEEAASHRQIGIVGDTSAVGSEGEEQAKDSAGRININTASEAQLCDIPGIGATRAAAIAAYRESHGGFQKPEDIMKVNGIKEGMYEKIKDSISVD
ncbi:MAG: helix-hairpin-helix domain-containing protein [Lachnospiraceae bacterium]|nr:helix-hairpin-helix domain-containing protein [Lachnospiraceae bacterium]